MEFDEKRVLTPQTGVVGVGLSANKGFSDLNWGGTGVVTGVENGPPPQRISANLD
ncbi:MAG: hypothetical protein HC862_17540 [Scytonema sp. RU_4_4]|nr:hypothetical protein [Scytonema sp. RU_4_4]